jgi:hypothetical protein
MCFSAPRHTPHIIQITGDIMVTHGDLLHPLLVPILGLALALLRFIHVGHRVFVFVSVL